MSRETTRAFAERPLIVLDYTGVAVRAAALTRDRERAGWTVTAEVLVPFPPSGGPRAAGEAARLALEELGLRLAPAQPAPRADHPAGPDALITSLGGAFTVAVGGVMRNISVDSARRTALSAGATVIDAFAIDEQRAAHEKRAALLSHTLDAFLLAGGVGEGILEAGGGRQAVFMAQTLGPALPGPRFGSGRPLPVVFAGSEEVRADIAAVLREKVEKGQAALIFEPNVRPDMPRENPGPAREALLDAFREGVVALSPAYRPVRDRSAAPAWPAGYILGAAARALGRGGNLLLCELGRETIEIHSVVGRAANRSVTATAQGLTGPGAGAGGVVGTGGVTAGERLARWLPYLAAPDDCADRAAQVLRDPGPVPETWEDLFADHALLRESLRAALAEHSRVAIELYGLQRLRVGEVFRYVSGSGGDTLIRMDRFDHIYLSGEVLGPYATPLEAALAAVDAFEPVGLTGIHVDPGNHLRLVATAAMAAGELDFDEPGGTAGADRTTAAGKPGKAGGPAEVLERVFSPTVLCLAPLRCRPALDGRPLAAVTVAAPGREPVRAVLVSGELARVDTEPGEPVTITARPRGNLDFGSGPGLKVTLALDRAPATILLDGRGRPLRLARDWSRQAARTARWLAVVYEDWPGRPEESSEKPGKRSGRPENWPGMEVRSVGGS